MDTLINIKQELAKIGLYPRSSPNKLAVEIRVRKTDELVAELSGTDLAINNTQQMTLDLLKRVLLPHGYKVN